MYGLSLSTSIEIFFEFLNGNVINIETSILVQILLLFFSRFVDFLRSDDDDYRNRGREIKFRSIPHLFLIFFLDYRKILI